MRPDANMTLPPIKDIKPPVEIPDLSWLGYWLLLILGVAVLAAAIFWAWRIAKGFRKARKEKAYLDALHRVEWSDPKKAAYAITKYGRLLATDDRRKELFEQLLPHLEKYKYRKEVGSVDEETRRRFELYKQVCDESL